MTNDFTDYYGVPFADIYSNQIEAGRERAKDCSCPPSQPCPTFRCAGYRRLAHEAPWCCGGAEDGLDGELCDKCWVRRHCRKRRAAKQKLVKP